MIWVTRHLIFTNPLHCWMKSTVSFIFAYRIGPAKQTALYYVHPNSSSCEQRRDLTMHSVAYPAYKVLYSPPLTSLTRLAAHLLVENNWGRWNKEKIKLKNHDFITYMKKPDVYINLSNTSKRLTAYNWTLGFFYLSSSTYRLVIEESAARHEAVHWTFKAAPKHTAKHSNQGTA